jgi:deoxyribodipyrimidine photo-lyase
MKVVPLYARDRNNVSPGHLAVSRLSPAIRHRLITEEEAVTLALREHSPGRVSKWVQEVYWRHYWKAWLARRPQAWTDYQERLSRPQSPGILDRCAGIEAAASGNAVIDAFARELSTTGYLHNHARMWVAAWWIHEARLPWELGAAWFFRHLLDGDPASNTLSWRWVAGLQTPGKTYLARRSNLEKYLDPAWLAEHAEGLADFEQPHAVLPPAFVAFPAGKGPLPDGDPDPTLATGIWIHEDDLAPETSPLASHPSLAIALTTDVQSWDAAAFPEVKREWLRTAVADAGQRANQHWKLPVETPLIGNLGQWAATHGLRQVLTLRPPVGPLNDQITALRSDLERCGARLILIDRAEDLALRPYATGGFFSYWEKTAPSLLTPR